MLLDFHCCALVNNQVSVYRTIGPTLVEKSSSKMSSPLRMILRVSRVYIKLLSVISSHDFLGLPDLFCATTFSLRTSKIQPVLHYTCPNHLILLVRSTILVLLSLDAKLCEKGVGAYFNLCLDIADPMDHGTVIMLETIQCCNEALTLCNSPQASSRQQF